MSLDYATQSHYDLIGTLGSTGQESPVPSSGAITPVTLADHYVFTNTTTKSIKTVGFPQGELFGVYTVGAGETANSLQISWYSGPDNINFGRQVNDSTSAGVSTLTLREFTITQTADYGTLAYTSQTGNFTVGLKVTGGTSAATGYIVADSDNGTTGTLTIADITGTFQSAEVITDSGSGSATTANILTSVTAFSIPLDLSSRYQRFSVKETGVASNFGNVYLGITLSGR